MRPTGDSPNEPRQPSDGNYEGMYEPLVAQNARFLDATKAVKLAGESFDTTIYVADSVLLRGLPDSDEVGGFIAFAREHGYQASVDQTNLDLAARAGRAEALTAVADRWVTPLK